MDLRSWLRMFFCFRFGYFVLFCLLSLSFNLFLQFPFPSTENEGNEHSYPSTTLFFQPVGLQRKLSAPSNPLLFDDGRILVALLFSSSSSSFSFAGLSSWSRLSKSGEPANQEIVLSGDCGWERRVRRSKKLRSSWFAQGVALKSLEIREQSPIRGSWARSWGTQSPGPLYNLY